MISKEIETILVDKKSYSKVQKKLDNNNQAKYPLSKVKNENNKIKSLSKSILDSQICCFYYCYLFIFIFNFFNIYFYT